MPDKLLTFFLSLFGIKKLSLLKFGMIDMTKQDVQPEIDNDDDNANFFTSLLYIYIFVPV
jgi:hypothetical protein